MFFLAVKDAKEKMPTLEQKFEAVSRPASRILTADGKVLYQVSEQNRIPLRLAQIPKHVQNAILAAEDKRFYSHNGVDGQGLMRSFVLLFKNGHVSGGGSTLTMQLAKRLYDGPEQSFRRKMQDIAFAYEIERTVANKNRILELYLNQVYFGEGAYGIGAAAMTYFHKDVSQLTISEAAMLARCVRLPRRQNPIRDYKVALENRDVVLKIMLEENMITEDQYDKAIEERPKVNKNPPHSTAFYAAGYGQHFIHHVLEVLDSENLGIDLKSGGYTIYTTIDSHLQRLAESAVRRVVAENHQYKVNEGAFVAMDSDGKILCEVGGTDFRKSQWNIITQARFQPGSGFKPFVYATALKEGVVHMDDQLSNARVHWEGDPDWDPENASPRENRPTYSLASALAQSVNRPAINTILKVGPSTVARYAYDYFGFRTKLAEVPSLALGSTGVHPLEMLEAYSVFMLRGDQVRPYPITKIVGPEGEIVKDYYPQKFTNVFDPVVCDEMDHLLEGVVQEGTGYPAHDIPDARGKTGTTNAAKDAWFNGYTDGIVGVSWVGNMRIVKGKPTQLPMASQVFGGTTAVYIWREVMKEARARFGKTPVADPATVSRSERRSQEGGAGSHSDGYAVDTRGRRNGWY